RRREPLRLLGLVVVVAAAEPREIVSVGPFFDEHLPIGQRDSFDRQLLAYERRPVERDFGAPRGEEGTVGRCESVDREIADEDGAGQQANVESADMNRPLQLLRAFAFNPSANRGT